MPIQLLEEALPIGCVKQIDRYLGYIKEGMTYYDAEIQEIMGKYGSILPNQQKQSIYLRLDSALEVGREKEYDKFVSYVEEGILESEPLARQIAQEYGFSTERLDQAINRETERFDRIESKTQIPAEESMPTVPAHLLEDMVKNTPQLENRK